MADKKVTIQVGTDVDLAEVRDLESLLQTVGNTSVNVDVHDQELIEAENHLRELQGWAEGADIDLDVEIAEAQAKVDEIKSRISQVDDETITPHVDNQTALQAVDQISQGFDRLKTGASELGEQMGTILESAGKQETNKAFLEHAVGAKKASKATEDINKAVQKLPGDDTVMQGLLSQAVAKDATLSAEALNDMGTAAADYFSAMTYYGKPATEAFQDMNNYLLAGNTAEIERSPILANHIDKLKEGTTLQERSKLLQEALNEEHWGGMSQQDTYNNKLETFNGMLERGQYNLGGMFQEGAKWGMDFIMKLDESSNGLVGMGLALANFASPLTDALFGLGQMATGMKAIKDLGFIKWLKDLELVTKAQALASEIAAAAQWLWNFAVIENPIVLVVIALIALAAAIIWAYQNVDWFREAVDNAWASLVQFGQQIYGVVTGAIQWLADLFNQFTSQLGLNTNDWIQAVLGFILFIPQLPLQLGVALTNAIAHALGFGNNFVQRMASAGANAVNGFVSYISQLPGKLAGELDKMLQMASDFIMKIANMMTGGAAGMVVGWITGSGEHSPGYMYEAFTGELEAMEKAPSQYDLSMKSVGQGMVDSFNPNLATSNNGTLQPSGNNITINIESVDNEERIQQIIQAVEDALAFDNLTAGRTV